MGKHSSPERAPFFRSIGAWALPWLLIVVVIAVALIVALDMVGDDPVRTSSDDDVEAASTPGTAASQGRRSGSKDDAQEKAHKEKERKGKQERDPTDEPAEIDAKSKLKPDGLTVQVLNGTGDGEADDVMADKLARLGYTVVAVSPSSRAYPRTTVFWVGDAQKSASQLAERFEWKVDPAPDNLSREVDLHVVVGADSL